MTTVGVIAEFDPFHNGHAYFLRRVRELTSADFIIAVMSGDFTQRGDAAIAGKRMRTRIALENGADIVMALPVQYSTASAEIFALGGVSLLDSLGVTEGICFGTEDDDLGILQEAALLLESEDADISEGIRSGLKSGLSYPAARLDALKAQSSTPAQIADALTKPNNILAVEYLKAMAKLDCSLTPVNIKREGTDHDSTNSYGIYCSAKMIRQTLKVTRSADSILKYVPGDSAASYLEEAGILYPIFLNDFSSLLKYRLLNEDARSLISYSDMNIDLARRIMKNLTGFVNADQFTELIKTKNMTYTRISRALIHTLLGITKEDMKTYTDSGITGFARVLGLKKGAAGILDKIREVSKVPVITRPSEYKSLLKKPFTKMFEDDLKASRIYDTVVREKFDTAVDDDLTHGAEKIDDMILF